jgi:hypothetical protein
MHNHPANFMFNRSLRNVISTMLLFAGPLAAQEFGVIRGIVTDDSTSAPLTGATIILRGTTQGTTTDDAGRFVLPRVPTGKFDLRISYIGFQEVKRNGRINAG